MIALRTWLLGGFFMVCAVAPTMAERWVKSNSDPKLSNGPDYVTCVDRDSVKKLPSGDTSYRYALCANLKMIWEQEIRCDQNFSAPKFTVRNRLVMASGAPKNEPWSTTSIYKDSMAWETMKFVCKR